MEDYLRMYLSQIVAVIVTIALIVFAVFFAKRYVPLDENGRKKVNKIRNDVILVILVLLGVYLFSSGTVNVTPRKVIDRSDVDQQQREFEERNTK